MVDYPPITPMPHLADWETTLTQIAAGPLAYAPDFPAIAARHEAFWLNELLDRPLFLASANKNPARPITRRLELLADRAAWFAAKMQDLEQTHRVGDTLPTVRVDFGPVLLGALFGAAVEFGADTSWTHAFIADDWSNAPKWTIRDDNHYWRLLHDLAALVAEDAAGRYVVMLPDVGASADVLLNLRGSSQLCTDIVDQPDVIAASIEAMYAAWHRTLSDLLEAIIGRGAGYTFYLGLWSSKPHALPACDFNAMIGPRPFKTLFLPDIARQAATLGCAIFHLDGPDAARHVDTLIETPEITAIQYVVGAGHPALDKIDVMKRVQAGGKPLQVLCSFNDVLAVADQLDPAGLCFLVDEVPGPAELDDLFAQFNARYGI
jgi:hypothetical protein